MINSCSPEVARALSILFNEIHDDSLYIVYWASGKLSILFNEIHDEALFSSGPECNERLSILFNEIRWNMISQGLKKLEDFLFSLMRFTRHS